MATPTTEDLYLAVQRLKLYFQENFPFKHTYYEGTADPTVGLGVTAPTGAFYAQKDVGGNVLKLWLKKTSITTGWEDTTSGGTGSGVSLWTPNTAYTTFADTSVPALIWEATSAKFYYNLADFTSEATFEADQLLGRWLELSPAGGASLVPWDLTPTITPAYLTITPFPPELPFANQAVIVGDTISLTAANVGTNVALGSFPNIPATGKYYFYFMFGATTGTYDMVSQQIGLDTLNGDGGSGGFTFDGGLAASSLNDTTVVDPLFAIGDVACAYIDADANTIGVTTPNGDFPAVISVPSGLGGISLDALLLIDITTGSASSTMDMSATDLGSGITPPVGYSLYGGTTQAGLPVDAIEGDHLKVTVGGTYNAVTYAVDDLAVVLDAGAGTVFPIEEKSTPVVANWLDLYTVTIGAAGNFPDFKALMLDIENNKRMGKVVRITLLDAVLTANDELLRIPQFRQVELIVPSPVTSAFSHYLDGWSNDYIQLQGEVSCVNFEVSNLQLVPLNLSGPTGLSASGRYNAINVYGAGVTVDDPYPYLRAGNPSGAIITNIGFLKGAVSGYSASSKLEVGFTTANTGITFLKGDVGGLINTNRPILMMASNLLAAEIKNIATSAFTGSFVIATAAFGRLVNLNCGTAGVASAIESTDSAVHVSNVLGTYTSLVPIGKTYNIYDKSGSVFFAALPATEPLVTQCIPIACSDETTALTAGAGKVTFRMPYGFTLTAVRASLTTAQVGGSLLTVDIKEGGASILSTLLTLDNTHKTSTTATTPAVISDTALGDDAEITIDITQLGDGTAKGLKVYLIGVRPNVS